MQMVNWNQGRGSSSFAVHLLTVNVNIEAVDMESDTALSAAPVDQGQFNTDEAKLTEVLD